MYGDWCRKSPLLDSIGNILDGNDTDHYYFHILDHTNGRSRSNNENYTKSTHLCELTSHSGIVVGPAQHRQYRPTLSTLSAAFLTPLTTNIAFMFTNVPNPFQRTSAGTPPQLSSSTKIDNPIAVVPGVVSAELDVKTQIQ